MGRKSKAGGTKGEGREEGSRGGETGPVKESRECK